jgi:hypothetical protein
LTGFADPAVNVNPSDFHFNLPLTSTEQFAATLNLIVELFERAKLVKNNLDCLENEGEDTDCL